MARSFRKCFRVLVRPRSASDAFREAFLALPVVSNPVPISLFLSASDIYRNDRSKGLTIRSSVDCLIAAIAIENRLPILHRDRDYDAIARYTALRVLRSLRSIVNPVA